MVLVQVANAWVNVLYKLALNDGMNLSIIVAYRYVFATAFIAPLAFIKFCLILTNYVSFFSHFPSYECPFLSCCYYKYI